MDKTILAKLGIDYSDLEKLEKILKSIGGSGSKSMSNMGAEIEHVEKMMRLLSLEWSKTNKKSSDFTRRMTSFEKLVKGMMKDERKHFILGEKYRQRESKFLKERTRTENRAAILRAKKERMREMIDATSAAPNLEKILRGTAELTARKAGRAVRYFKRAYTPKKLDPSDRRFGRSFRQGGMKEVGATVLKDSLTLMTRGIDKLLGRIMGLVVQFLKHPMAQFMQKLMDFDGLFRFNQQVLATVGGVSMLGKRFSDLSKSSLHTGRQLSSLGDRLVDTGVNFRYMMTSAERLEGLQGIAATGRNAASILGENFENIGDVMTDMSLQARVFSRAMGRSVTDVSNYFGELIHNIGFSVSEMGQTFAFLFKKSTDLNISQQLYMDLIRNSARNMTTYNRTLQAAGDVLELMGKKAVASPKQVEQAFDAMNRLFENQAAQVMLMEEARNQGSAMNRAMREMLNAEMDRMSQFGLTPDMNRAEFNKQISGMTPEKARQAQEAYESSRLLQDLISGKASFFDIQASAAEGGIGVDIGSLLVNALSRRFAGGPGVRGIGDVDKGQTARVLADVLGMSLKDIQALRRTGVADEDIVARVKERGEGQSELLLEVEAIFHELKEYTEAPAKTFEVIIEEIIRTIQQLIMELVKDLMPYALDILSLMLKGIGGIITGIVSIAENMPTVDTGEIGRNLYNLGVTLAGGQKISADWKAKSGKGSWFDVVEGLSKASGTDDFGKSISATTTVKGVGERLREQGQAVYATGLESASRELYGSEGLTTKIAEISGVMRSGITKLQEGLKSETDATKRKELEDRLLEEEKKIKNLGKLFDELTAYRDNFSKFLDESENATFGIAAMATAAEEARSKTSEFSNRLGEILSGTPSTRSTEIPKSSIDDISDRIRSTAGSSVLSLPTLPGHADGGIQYEPGIVKFAEEGPEAAIPISAVPRVFAETLDKAGSDIAAGPKLSIGALNFYISGSDAGDAKSLARRVRELIEIEFEGMLRTMRTS